jgi:hypothetical protein
VQVTVAAPTNFHQTEWKDLGDGLLYFKYKWGSTSGDLNDLGGCMIGECVDYPGGNPYFYPAPWVGYIDNPFIRTVCSATLGDIGLSDIHFRGDIQWPYQNASFTATQHYEYHDCCGSYITLLGPLSIYRQVYEAPCATGWRYRVEKTGVSASTCIP